MGAASKRRYAQPPLSGGEETAIQTGEIVAREQDCIFQFGERAKACAVDMGMVEVTVDKWLLCYHQLGLNSVDVRIKLVLYHMKNCSFWIFSTKIMDIIEYICSPQTTRPNY
jgi:hypothetical protein